MPEDVVKARPNAPGAESMKQDRVRLARFVGVVFVPQLMPGMVGIEELDQLGAELCDLVVGQNPHAGQVALVVIESDLLVAESIAFPLGARLGKRKQVANKFVASGKIGGHWRFSSKRQLFVE